MRCCLNMKLHFLMMVRRACLKGLPSTLNQTSIAFVSCKDIGTSHTDKGMI